MDAVSEARLSLVCPVLAEKIATLETMMGEPISVEQGYRSYSDQAKLYAQGRTAPGEIVTKAPPGHSWHEFGLAVDVCPDRLLLVPNWGPDDPDWVRMAKIGESLGLFSGSEFHSICDRPHFQLTGTFPVSPNDEARIALLDSGKEAVWTAAGLTDESSIAV